MRGDFGLAGRVGVKLASPDPVEIPDLYLKPAVGPSRSPRTAGGAVHGARSGTVIAETLDRGHRRIWAPGRAEEFRQRGVRLHRIEPGICLPGTPWSSVRITSARSWNALGKLRAYQVDPARSDAAFSPLPGQPACCTCWPTTGQQDEKLRMRESTCRFRTCASASVCRKDGASPQPGWCARGAPLERWCGTGWFEATVHEVRIPRTRRTPPVRDSHQCPLFFRSRVKWL